MAEDVEVVTIVANSGEQTYVENQYQSHGVNLDHCSFLIALSDTYWTRDYGPWFIFNGNDEQGIIDFVYNRPRPYDDQIPTVYGNWQQIPVYDMNVIHTGGNYMTDGQGIAVSTDLVWSENPGYTHQEINDIMEEYLGITTYHVVPDVLGEYIQHIDCWAKFLAPDVIMIIEVHPSHNHYDEIENAVDYFENQINCYGTPYEIERVYAHQEEPYINSLILNDKILVPITGSQWDDEALDAYEVAMPGYDVLGFSGSWYSTDALHCRTMGIVDRYMLYIEHTPLNSTQSNPDGYEVQTMIFPYSGENLIIEASGVYWKVDNASWEFLPFDSLGNNYYHAVIPPQPQGSVVSYYLHGEDESGRVEHHPYIGEPGAYSFLVNSGENTPPEKPEKPEGPSRGRPGVTYPYTSRTNDLDGDQVSYMWDWGDGNYSIWLGPYDSGDTCEATYTWSEQGTYAVRVKAKDIHGEESPWSDPLSVTMPLSFSFIELFDRFFPRLYQLVTFILKEVLSVF
jgi:agmatine/peptidylarginine deiminase